MPSMSPATFQHPPPPVIDPALVALPSDPHNEPTLYHTLRPVVVDNQPYLMGQRGSGQTTGCCHDIWSGLCVELSP